VFQTGFFCRRKAAAAGLAIGVSGALKHSGGLWFGWHGELSEDAPGDCALTVKSSAAWITDSMHEEKAIRRPRWPI
jgi:trehalose 6-phosphate synthase